MSKTQTIYQLTYDMSTHFKYRTGDDYYFTTAEKAFSFMQQETRKEGYTKEGSNFYNTEQSNQFQWFKNPNDDDCINCMIQEIELID